MTVQDEVNAWLPLLVDRAENLDPFSLLGGIEKSWSLFLGSPFTISRAGMAPVDSEVSSDAELMQAIDALRGLAIVRASIEESLIDPSFWLSDGSTITINSDSDLDPWVLQLGGVELVLVGAHTPNQ